MILKDDRTIEQTKDEGYVWLVIGTDTCMSGWGRAEKGKSYAAWACKFEDLDRVEAWVRNRKEMKRVRIVHDSKGNYHPRNAGHCHIYVVTEDHPALKNKR